MIISIVICTHNPRLDYLGRTLKALQAQTLSKDQWELVVVDNASDPPLSGILDLNWHERSRIVFEPELGILPGRVRGLKQTCTPLVLFVDDDNILAPDYLEEAVNIAESHPFLGVWGGSIVPEFEVDPPEWITQFSLILACFEVEEDRWSNLKFAGVTTPPTAGMCLRRTVADVFVRTVESDPRRKLLGRRGKNQLTNGEDTDLALTACDIGLGMGQFKRLHLTHLIPSSRLSESYLLRLTEGSYYCGYILDALRGKFIERIHSNGVRRFLGRIRRAVLWPKHRRRFFEAKMRAQLRAIETLASWKHI